MAPGRTTPPRLALLLDDTTLDDTVQLSGRYVPRTVAVSRAESRPVSLSSCAARGGRAEGGGATCHQLIGPRDTPRVKPSPGCRSSGRN